MCLYNCATQRRAGMGAPAQGATDGINNKKNRAASSGAKEGGRQRRGRRRVALVAVAITATAASKIKVPVRLLLAPE